MKELDFKNAPVGDLFFRQVVPALLGMMASALYVVVDGIFVGQGIGTDAIAAVNINNPLMTFVSALGMMFGMGGGVMVSVHLSQGRSDEADRTFTRILSSTFLITSVITVLLCIFHREVGFLLGANEVLIDDVGEYMFWYALSFPFMVMMTALPFFIRLTDPAVPMWALSIGAVINVILDYLFIFVLHWGLKGAALATDIGQILGALIMLVYVFRPGNAVSFVRHRPTFRAVADTFSDLGRTVVLGFSVFLSELTVSIIGIAGNFAFMRHLGEHGVAAYSIVCYIFPVIFMVFNAAVQSIQPIVSYNYGCGQLSRSKQALRLALGFSSGAALLMTAVFLVTTKTIVSFFIPDPSDPAWGIAVSGLPFFAADFLFFGVNTVMIGYYMSLERVKLASVLTVVRGTLPVLLFLGLPLVLGDRGLWLSVAVSDLVMTLVIIAFQSSRKAGGGRHVFP